MPARPPGPASGRRTAVLIGAAVLVGAAVIVLIAALPSPGGRTSDAARSAAATSVPPPTTVGRVAPAPATTAPAPPATTVSRPLAGKVVGIDPGHNGGNASDPSYINTPVWNGREQENCDTTGTKTDSGYTEAQFNFNVARYLTQDLEAEGARVVLTRTSNTGVGPCVTTRASILNAAHAEVAVDIHADGGPVSGRGFDVLEPVADGPNDGVVGASGAFGSILRQVYLADTGMPESDYYGTDGIVLRDDLAGLNLTTVPKVLIECGNMQNPTDAALLATSSFQALAAKAMAQAVTTYLAASPG
jgi:N-acetylmuramoyl-L-alanine amidase